ncbi:hypothetical protein REPUB_Repub11eG0042600 [Reevesia pubescens]
MAKASMISLVSLAICLSSFLSFSNAEDTFFVQGTVYCDTCRVEFVTRLSEPIKGATVKLECRSPTNDSITYSQETSTDELGNYSIEVKGDHGDEICEVGAVKSPREDCKEVMEAWNKAKVVLTNKSGVVEPIRFANSLGFLKKEAVPGCEKVLEELGF